MSVKFKVIFILSVVLLISSVSAAYASAPSVTMLSTKTCPACAQMEKVLKEIKSKYADKISTEHIYLEDKPELAEKYNVRYVPTLIFKDSKGKEIAQEIGYRSLEQVLKVFSDKNVKIN